MVTFLLQNDNFNRFFRNCAIICGLVFWFNKKIPMYFKLRSRQKKHQKLQIVPNNCPIDEKWEIYCASLSGFLKDNIGKFQFKIALTGSLHGINYTISRMQYIKFKS